MKIEGIIQSNGNINLTCCSTTSNIYIGDKSLNNILCSYFNLDAEYQYHQEQIGNQGYHKYDIDYNIRFIIKDGSDICKEVHISKFYFEFEAGCYSELTCGYGGYLYFYGENNTNLLDDLDHYNGKYIVLEFDEKRELLINELLN